MDKISKGFVGRTVRAVLFIILIIVFCTAISSAGIYLASRYGLTQSREQVPLTALYLGNEGKVELPGRGKMVEGKGWRLRNSRDSYTLTLDNAVIENTVMKNTVMESTQPDSSCIRFPAHPEYILSIGEAKEKLAGDDNFKLVSIRSRDEFLGRTSGYGYIDRAGEPEGIFPGHGWLR